MSVEVAAKRFELLHELVPSAASMAFLVNPTNALFTEAETREAQNAARALRVPDGIRGGKHQLSRIRRDASIARALLIAQREPRERDRDPGGQRHDAAREHPTGRHGAQHHDRDVFIVRGRGFGVLQQDADAVGYRVAQADKFPEWRAGNEFKAIRDKQLHP